MLKTSLHAFQSQEFDGYQKFDCQQMLHLFVKFLILFLQQGQKYTMYFYVYFYIREHSTVKIFSFRKEFTYQAQMYILLEYCVQMFWCGHLSGLSVSVKIEKVQGEGGGFQNLALQPVLIRPTDFMPEICSLIYSLTCKTRTVFGLRFSVHVTCLQIFFILLRFAS